MDIATANSAQSQPPLAQTAQTASKASIDYDSFLQLLIAQLKNQDPLNPMDSTEYVAQLAAFSNVEQAIQTNAKLDSLLSSMTLTQADGLIGRTVTSADGVISGEVEAVRITAGGAIAELEGGGSLALGPGIVIS